METGITVERAIELVSDVKPVDTEQLPANQAMGRVLAQDVRSPMDQPPWPRSPLDGFAFRAEDSAGASPDSSVTLPVSYTVFAGGWPERPVRSGEAVRIMTGAPIPDGCDCVLRQEDTDMGADCVKLYKSLTPWSNYCFKGEDFKTGDLLIPAGTRLTGTAVGALSSAGLYRSDVTLILRKRVKFALFCTGDELVSAETSPLPNGKIYSSLAPMLTSRLIELGCEPVMIRGEFGDDAAALADAIREAARDADVIITTGGVSVGAKDILHETLPILGADRVFWQVRLKPGSPMMFSFYHGTPILSLSGNPFAAGATFELFARPLLAALSGCDDALPHRTSAVLDTTFKKHGKIPRYLRGVFRDGHVTLSEGHSSGQLASAVGTNCLALIPPSDVPLEAGCTVKVLIL